MTTPMIESNNLSPKFFSLNVFSRSQWATKCLAIYAINESQSNLGLGQLETKIRLQQQECRPRPRVSYLPHMCDLRFRSISVRIMSNSAAECGSHEVGDKLSDLAETNYRNIMPIWGAISTKAISYRDRYKSITINASSKIGKQFLIHDRNIALHCGTIKDGVPLIMTFSHAEATDPDKWPEDLRIRQFPDCYNKITE